MDKRNRWILWAVLGSLLFLGAVIALVVVGEETPDSKVSTIVQQPTETPALDDNGSRSIVGPNPATCEDIIDSEMEARRREMTAYQDLEKEIRADVQSGKEPSWKLANLHESREASWRSNNRRLAWLQLGVDSSGDEALSPGKRPAHCTYRWWRWDWDHRDPARDGLRGYVMDSLGVTWRDFEDGKVTDTLCRMVDFDTQESVGSGLKFIVGEVCS